MLSFRTSPTPPIRQNQTSITMLSLVVSYLTANFRFSRELLAFWIAFQGAVEVRAGVNRHKNMHWCHAFLLTLVTGHGGATFAPLWMGRSISMLNNDFHVACCILSFVLVTHVPLCFKLSRTFPVTLVTVMFAQLFRAMGIIRYTSLASREFAASDYYPIPVFAPIAYGTLLGNMGGFFAKSFHSHLEKHGVPWSFQNGTSYASSLFLFQVKNVTCSLTPITMQASFALLSIISLFMTRRVRLDYFCAAQCTRFHLSIDKWALMMRCLLS